MPSHGVLVSFGARRFPKGNEGKRVSSGYNRRRRLATRSSGKQQAERTAVRTAPIVCPEESPLVRPQAHTPCPGWSLTRRLRRGRWGCRPEGGSTFFRSERKYQRKHAARRLREKGFYCPFCRRGSQCRAHWSWPAFTYGRGALVLTFFRRQNGRAFFPPLPIAARFPHSWRWADSNGGAWNVSALHSRFCKAKGQRHFKTMLAFGASRRPYRPTAVCTGQLAGNRTRPASRGTRRATAVKPRPSRMSPYTPARPWRAVRGQGYYP